MAVEFEDAYLESLRPWHDGHGWIRALGWPQFLCALTLVVTLLGLALAFGTRQVVTLRAVNSLPLEEQRPAWWQATRRLVGCVLLLAIAVSIAYAFAYLEIRAQARTAGHVLDAQQRSFARHYGATWLTVMVMLVLVLFLTAWDLWVLRRRGALAQQRLLAERQVLQEREAALRRRQQGS